MKSVLYLLISLLLISAILSHHRKKNRKLSSRHMNTNTFANLTADHINFISGVGIGYGLSVEATEELKKCFIEKKNANKIVVKFLKKVNAIKLKFNTTNIQDSFHDMTNSTKLKIKKSKPKVVKFTRHALNFFANLKDCAPFRETFFSFVKSRLINIGVKGVAYAVGGVIGLAIKYTYDIYKLLAELKNFYHTRSTRPVDYLKLGSSVGKIIYYSQNMLIRK